MPEHLLSRRALAGAFPFAALVGPAPTTALARLTNEDDSDAELLDLGRRWQAWRKEIARLTELLYGAEDRIVTPPYPEAIYFRPSDRRFWQSVEEPELIDALATGRRFYRTAEARNRLRRQIEYAASLERGEHDVALIARATEILDAFDQWRRDCQASEERAGVPEVMAELARETEAGTEIMRKIVLTSAHTIKGFVLKARLARWCMDDDETDMDEMLQAALESDEVICRDAVAVSLVRDLLSFAEQRTDA